MLSSDAQDILNIKKDPGSVTPGQKQHKQQRSSGGGDGVHKSAGVRRSSKQMQLRQGGFSAGGGGDESDVVFKRPEGMHRELYNLLVYQGKDGSSAGLQSLTTSNTGKGYSLARLQLGSRKVRKWKWTPFTNPAREDGFQLNHWAREGTQVAEYPFAKFNKKVDPVVFTDVEYDQYLQDLRWTKEDTRKLLATCHSYGLRWPVIIDRMLTYKEEEHETRLENGVTEENGVGMEEDVKISITPKMHQWSTMEDIKERYYGIVNTLNAVRELSAGAAPPQQLYFDAESERRRKEQLVKLWDRTEEQVKEEEELRAEIKRIEARKKDRERKANEVQKLISSHYSTDSHKLSQADGSILASGGMTRLRKALKHRTAQHNVHQLMSEAQIRWPVYSAQGVHLCSQEMRVPSNVSKLKCKNLEVVVDKMKLDPYPCAFQDVIQAFNRFRSNIIVLQELKTTLGGLESEVDQLVERVKIEKNMTVSVDPRLRVGDAFYNRTADQAIEESMDSDQKMSDGLALKPATKGKGGSGKQKVVPVTSRRIAQWIDIQPLVATSTRKRRVQLSPTSSTPTSTQAPEASSEANAANSSVSDELMVIDNDLNDK